MNYTIMALLGAKDVGLRSTMMRASGDVESGVKRMESSTSRASKIALGLKAALAGVAVVAAAFLISGITGAIRFEAAMRNVNSISRLSEESLAGLSQQVINLSTQVPQSAQTLAQGLYDIASSGFQGAAGMEVLEVSAKAASAGLTTTDVAARAISASLNAYGLTARDAADVSDILFQTVNLGVVTFEELANELGDVVGGAAAAGVELDEVGAAIAAMTLSGLSAAEATTSLNRLLEKIVKPSDALSATFRNLGHESGKAALDTLGLHGTMELLRMATGGQVTALLRLFPEIRAARGAFALMAADGQNYATTFAGIADEQTRAGATQRAFNEQMKAVSNQWKLFVNGVNAAALRLGTAFIPVLKSGLQQLRDFGSGASRVFQQLATAAAPTVRSIGQAMKEIARLAGEVYNAVQPIVRVLGVAFAAAAIVGLRGLAEALAAVAGVLADHPALVQAVAFALGSVLVARLLTAGAAAAKFAVQFRALLLMESVGPILSSIATRVTALGIGLRGLFTGNVVERTLGFGTAIQGVGRAMATIAPAVAIAGVFGWITTLNQAKDKAKDLRNELEQGIDTSSIENYRESLAEAAGQAQQRMGELRGHAEGLGNSFQAWGEQLRGAVTFGLVDFEDQTLEARAAIDELGASMEESQQLLSVMDHDLATVANQLGISQEQAAEFFQELDYDPSRGEQFIEMREQVRQLIAEASGATPAAEQLGESFDTAGNLATSAADRVAAFKDTLDALIGTMLGAFDAETAYAQGIQELTAALSENGTTMDAWTEGGRANREALSGAVEAAIDWAAEIATSTGSLQQGADALGGYRQQLIDTMVQTGMSREEAEGYINALGLTPENLQTVIELAGTAEATAAMGQVFDALMNLDLTVAEPVVELDNLPFLNNAQAVGEFLRQVGQAAPEARVLLNDQQFVPTAAQVTAWSQMYDNSTPEAIALLNIIDPQHRFATLGAAAAGWDAAHPTATAGLHDQATGALAGIAAAAARLDGRVVTISVRAVPDATASAAIFGGKLSNRRWGGIHTAQSGMAWEAGVYNQPTIFFGERPTGGEAMIPRLGRTERSMAILRQAANWYDAEVVPRSMIRPEMPAPVVNVSEGPKTLVQIPGGVHIHANTYKEGRAAGRGFEDELRRNRIMVDARIT